MLQADPQQIVSSALDLGPVLAGVFTGRLGMGGGYRGT
jgi:hypothetical protein